MTRNDKYSIMQSWAGAVLAPTAKGLDMSQKRVVQILVIEAVATIMASPKNRSAEFRDKAQGAVGMAYQLGVITCEEHDTAQRRLRTAAAWRGVMNFANMQRWADDRDAARDDFSRVWG